MKKKKKKIAQRRANNIGNIVKRLATSARWCSDCRAARRQSGHTDWLPAINFSGYRDNDGVLFVIYKNCKVTVVRRTKVIAIQYRTCLKSKSFSNNIRCFVCVRPSRKKSKMVSCFTRRKRTIVVCT